jgi:hypothetical protein
MKYPKNELTSFELTPSEHSSILGRNENYIVSHIVSHLQASRANIVIH